MNTTTIVSSPSARLADRTAVTPKREALPGAAGPRRADRTNPPPVTAELSPGRRVGDRGLLDSDTLETIDRMYNAWLGRVTLGISPVSVMIDGFDWWAHLATSPGKQLELATKAARKGARFARYAASLAAEPDAPPCIEPLPQDHRFDHPAWRRFPYNLLYQGFLLNQQWWHNATTGIRGVTRHHEAAVSFIARQLLDMYSPSNFPLLNPEIIEASVEERGANLLRGAQNLADDWQRSVRGGRPAGTEPFVVGKTLAVTPGKVVFRNRLLELIQYAPSTATVQQEPVLVQSAWMMKYYIMDLSPHNSLVKYLVDRGHTVFMISWLNPGPDDRDLGMEDYRRDGTMAAVEAVSALLPGRRIHAVGYCLGGILLTIAAATMAREGDDRLASVTLFTTLTDFTEVGELGVFMDRGEVTLLEDMMWQQGYLGPEQAGGGFQLLKSKDLIWSKMVRDYFLGRREPMFDLMAWNADGTRMPYRQHSELMHRLYGDNELFEGKYRVDGKPIALSDIRVPIFCVAATYDHVAPWRSVYKLHLQSDAPELVFVLTTGGHNVGIVNEPGHPNRSYQRSVSGPGDPYVDPDAWQAAAPKLQGSWWPDWQAWLVTHSSGEVRPPEWAPPGTPYAPLGEAPGTYVYG